VAYSERRPGIPITVFCKLIGTRWFDHLLDELDEAKIDLICGEKRDQRKSLERSRRARPSRLVLSFLLKRIKWRTQSDRSCLESGSKSVWRLTGTKAGRSDLRRSDTGRLTTRQRDQRKSLERSRRARPSRLVLSFLLKRIKWRTLGKQVRLATHWHKGRPFRPKAVRHRSSHYRKQPAFVPVSRQTDLLPDSRQLRRRTLDERRQRDQRKSPTPVVSLPQAAGLG
jgi:hypothetical protein